MFVAVLCMASLTGCGLFRGAARHAEDVPVPPPHVEVPAPPVGGAPVEEAAAVTARKAEILAPVDDLNAEERRQVIEAACGLRSLYDLSQVEDENELVYEAAVELGGDEGRASRQAGLRHLLRRRPDGRRRQGCGRGDLRAVNSLHYNHEQITPAGEP